MPNAIWQEEGDGNQFRITTGTFPLAVPANPLKRVFVLWTDGPKYVEFTGTEGGQTPPDETPRAPTQLTAPTLFRTGVTGQLGYNVGTYDAFPSPTLRVRLFASAALAFTSPVERSIPGQNYLLSSPDLDLPYFRLEVTPDNGVGNPTFTSAVFGPILAGDIPAPVETTPTVNAGAVPSGTYQQGTGTQTFSAAAAFAGINLVYSAPGAPAAVTINSSTGVISVNTTNALSLTTITIRATNSAGFAETTTTVSIAASTVARYILPDNMWTAQQNFEGALGRRQVRVDPSQLKPTGHDLVWYGGPEPLGRTDQVRVIEIGDPPTVSNGTMAVGSTCYNWLWWRERTGGTDAAPVYTFHVAVSGAKSFVIATPTNLPQIASTSWQYTEAPGGRADFSVIPTSTITKNGGDTASDNGSVQFRVTSAQVSFNPRVQVHLPSGYTANGTERWPVIYYLNGQSAALRTPFTMAALVNAAAIIVSFDCDDVDDGLPNGGNGWYVNSPAIANLNWTNFFLDELIPYIDTTYRTAGPSRRIVMGNSMGAFGALNAVAERPEAFCAAAALSGGVSDYTSEQYNDDYMVPVMGPYNSTVWQRWEVLRRLKALKDAGRQIPPFYVTVGQLPDVYAPVQRFRSGLTANGFVQGTDYFYLEVSSGDHSYGAPRDAALTVVPWALGIANARPASNGSTVAIPTGYTLRAGRFSGTLGTPSDANTAQVTPGVVLRTSTALSNGVLSVGNLWWRETATGTYTSATTAPKSFTVTTNASSGGVVTVVNSTTQLYNTILSQASGAIEIAPGNYGPVQRLVRVNKPQGLTIRPQNRNNPPVFTGDTAFYLEGCSGLTFDGLTFAPTSRNIRGYHVGDGVSGMIECQWFSSNITIRNCLFNGANFNIVLRRASNCLVEWNTLEESPQDYIRIYEDNDGHIIQNNWFKPHNWDYANYPNAHADMIQGTVTGNGNNTAPKNLIIRQNRFEQATRGNEDRPEAWGAHNIFFGNNRMVGGFGSTALGGGVYNVPGAYYENILIENNFFVGSHPNGVGMQGVVGLTVRGNVFRRMAGTPDTSSTYCPMINMYFAGTSQANRNVNCSNNVHCGPRIWSTEGSGPPWAAGTSSFTDTIFNNNTAFPTGWVNPVVGRYGYNGGVPI